MLPSRLFKNTGIPHRLRSLLIPSPNLPPNISVQLRLRLGVIRNNSSLTTPPPASSSSAAAFPHGDGSEPPDPTSAPTNKLRFKSDVEPRMQITFTCTVTNCGTRSTHEFSKRSYTNGIVLVECPGCKNRHLIADHLGWFKDGTHEGKFKTIEDMMKQKGEVVKRGRLADGEVLEYAPDS